MANLGNSVVANLGNSVANLGNSVANLGNSVANLANSQSFKSLARTKDSSEGHCLQKVGFTSVCLQVEWKELGFLVRSGSIAPAPSIATMEFANAQNVAVYKTAGFTGLAKTTSARTVFAFHPLR